MVRNNSASSAAVGNGSFSGASVVAAPDVSEVEFVRALPMFKGLTDSQYQGLFSAAKIAVMAPGTMLFMPGDAADRFYVLLKGRVEMFVLSPSGRESVIDVVGQGETFGLASIFDDGAFPMGARVADDVRLMVVPADPFLGHLKHNFQVILRMMANMSFQLRSLVRQISEFKLKTTGQRLGGFLIGLTDVEFGEATVRLPYDKKLLANRLGMKPESLSRALGRLRSVGVSGDQDVLVIRDIETLRNFCQEGDLSGG